jgi:type I restriction enzyme S subunit
MSEDSGRAGGCREVGEGAGVSGWRGIAFKDLLAEPVRNGIYKQKEFHGRGAKIVNMGELFSYPRLINVDMKRVEISEAEKKKCLLKNGDLIFARRSLTAEGAGKCSIVREVVEDTTFESSIIRARPNQEKAVPDFLYYYFNSPYGKYLLGTILRQVAVSGITGSDLMELVLNIPNAYEQKAIAAVLSSLDDKIDLLHRQNQTLEAMAATLFRQWFVEEAQEDWEEVPMGTLFEISSGKGIKKEQLADDGLFPVLGANGEIGRTNDYLFDERLIFTGRVGTVGNIFIVGGKKVWLSDNTLVFRKMRWFYFVYFSLKAARLADYNAGSTQPLIRQSDIKEIPISLPSEARQG